MAGSTKAPALIPTPIRIRPRKLPDDAPWDEFCDEMFGLSGDAVEVDIRRAVLRQTIVDALQGSEDRVVETWFLARGLLDWAHLDAAVPVLQRAVDAATGTRNTPLMRYDPPALARLPGVHRRLLALVRRAYTYSPPDAIAKGTNALRTFAACFEANRAAWRRATAAVLQEEDESRPMGASASASVADSCSPPPPPPPFLRHTVPAPTKSKKKTKK